MHKLKINDKSSGVHTAEQCLHVFGRESVAVATLLITPLQMAVRGPAEDVGWKLIYSTYKEQICPEIRTPEVTSQSERMSANPERSSAPKHGGGVEANPAAAATSHFIL